jgi:hypothetical protein
VLISIQDADNFILVCGCFIFCLSNVKGAAFLGSSPQGQANSAPETLRPEGEGPTKKMSTCKEANGHFRIKVI